MIKIENAIVETSAKGQAEFLGEMKTLTLTIGDFTWNIKVPRGEFNEATCNCLMDDWEDKEIEWISSPDPDFPDIQWIDDETGEIKKAE
jgi:hypothetical protein